MTTVTRRFTELNGRIEEVSVVALTATTGYVVRVSASGLMGYYGPGYQYKTLEDVLNAYRKLDKKRL